MTPLDGISRLAMHCVLLGCFLTTGSLHAADGAFTQPGRSPPLTRTFDAKKASNQTMLVSCRVEFIKVVRRSHFPHDKRPL